MDFHYGELLLRGVPAGDYGIQGSTESVCLGEEDRHNDGEAEFSGEGEG